MYFLKLYELRVKMHCCRRKAMSSVRFKGGGVGIRGGVERAFILY